MPKLLRNFIELLFRRHSAELVKFAQQRGHADDAEDLVQEAFLQLVERRDLNGIEHPKAYLYKVTGNLGVSQHRWHEVRRKYHDDDEVDLDTLLSPEPEPDAVVESQTHALQLMDVLYELPEIQRDALIFRRLGGLSLKQVAASLGVSEATAQRHIRKALQHCLDRLGPDLEDGDRFRQDQATK